MQRGVDQVQQRHERGRPGRHMSAGIELQRDGGATHQRGLDRQERLRSRRQCVDGRQHVGEEGRVVAQMCARRAVERCRPEDGCAVHQVPHQVVFEAEVEAARAQVPVVFDGDRREVHRIRAGSGHRDEQRRIEPRERASQACASPREQGASSPSDAGKYRRCLEDRSCRGPRPEAQRGGEQQKLELPAIPQTHVEQKREQTRKREWGRAADQSLDHVQSLATLPREGRRDDHHGHRHARAHVEHRVVTRRRRRCVLTRVARHRGGRDDRPKAQSHRRRFERGQTERPGQAR